MGLFQHAGVPSPGFRLCRLDDDAEHLAGQLHYPCVVKPLGLSGSQGVIRVDDEPEFVRAVGRLTKILDAENRLRKAASRTLLADPVSAAYSAGQGDQPQSLTSETVQR